MKILMPIFEVTNSTKCYETYTRARAENAKTDQKLKSITKNHYDHLKNENTKNSLVDFLILLTKQNKESLAVIGSKHQIYKDLLANLKENDTLTLINPGTFKTNDKEYNIQSFNVVATQKHMHKMHMARATAVDSFEIEDFNDDQFDAIKAGDDLYTKFTKNLANLVFVPYFNKNTIIDQDFHSASNVISESFRKANELTDKELSECLGLNVEFAIDL